MRCPWRLAVAVLALAVYGTASRGDCGLYPVDSCPVECGPGQVVTWERDIYLDVQTCEVCYPECSEWFQFYTVQWEGYYKKCDGQAVCYSCAADEAGCCFWPGGDDPCYTTPPPP